MTDEILQQKLLLIDQEIENINDTLIDLKTIHEVIDNKISRAVEIQKRIKNRSVLLEARMSQLKNMFESIQKELFDEQIHRPT